MAKNKSLKFWFAFWSISTILLIAWFLFCQIFYNGFKSLSPFINLAPISKENREKYQTLTYFADYFLQKDGKQKTFLVLFQNNLEIRPGGGYLGSFGIVKAKDRKIISIETHDLSNFDSKVPNNIKPPYPLEETLKIRSWKLRDSNFSPDFEENAKKAIEFYELGKGEEKFDGVIGVTSNVLTSLLKITGPISIDGYPGTYDSENAIISLEYQVEKGFVDQGIEREDRKDIMNDLFKEIIHRIFDLNTAQKLDLFQILMEDLSKKDIQLYFSDPILQERAKLADWAGKVDSNWKKDYLLVLDANIGAFKSDYYVKRSIDYTVDLSGEKPIANLKITYNHTAQQKDWMTTDYRTYLRIYAPKGSWLNDWKNTETKTVFGDEFGKKYFGAIVKVPVGESKTTELSYTLPDSIKDKVYDLKIQKESGINDVPASLHTIDKNGKKDYNIKLNSDWILNNE